MKSQKQGGYHFLALSLLLTLPAAALTESADELKAKRAQLQSETDALRKANADSEARLELIRQKIAELLEKSRSLNGQIEAAAAKIEAEK